MSDDGDYGNERHPASRGGRLTTRTRLPDGEGGGRPPTPRPGRSLITVVGVIVLLIAAIAFANRGGGGDGSDDGGGGGGDGGGTDSKLKAQPTAPTGEKPRTSGFPKTDQGAQSAAANYAVALGGDGMFKRESRHDIVDSVYTEEAAEKLKGPQDSAYSKKLLRKLGLDEDGDAPKGATFVSRTIPIGTKVKKLDGDRATVSVWYTGLIGLAGKDSTNPVHTNWHTWTFKLQWTGDDWKIVSDDQKDGPAPVPGDVPASGADEITDAVREYGGFSYAR